MELTTEQLNTGSYPSQASGRSVPNAVYPLSRSESLSLDFVRGAAAQAVVVGHALALLELYPRAGNPHPLYIQNAGVIAFFVLSGFLISYTVSQKTADPQYSFGSYLGDRFARIFTAYLPALFLVFVLDRIFISAFGQSRYPYWSAFDARTFVGNAFMLQDYPALEVLTDKTRLAKSFAITSFGTARPFWTVAIEWWIYLFFGFLVFHGRLGLSKVAKAAALAVLLIVPLYNIGGRGNGLTLVWFAGAAIFLLRGTRLRTIRVSDATWICVGIAAAMLWRSRLVLWNMYDAVLAGLFAAMLLFALTAIRPLEVSEHSLGARSIRLFANYSFSLYLIHYSILLFVAEFKARGNPWVLFTVGVVVSNLAALGFASVTEFHHKRVRRRLRMGFGI